MTNETAERLLKKYTIDVENIVRKEGKSPAFAGMIRKKQRQIAEVKNILYNLENNGELKN